jgi:hypothetical protein
LLSGEPSDSGMSVESGVEAQDSANGMLFHNREMQGVASRKPRRSEDDSFCALRGNQVDRQYLIDDSQDGVECRLDGVAARVSSLHDYEIPFFSASSIAVTKVSNSSSVV